MIHLILDSNLNFNQHISELCKRIARQLNVLKRFSRILDANAKLCLYKTFILSHFNFCPVVWMSCGETNKLKMDKLQKRALRFIFNDYCHKTSYGQLLSRAGLPSLELSRLRKLALEAYKAINNIGPKYINELVNLNSSSRATRASIPRVRTTKNGLYSFRFTAAKVFNDLPLDLRTCIDLKTFKAVIASWQGPACKCSVCSFAKACSN